MVAQFLTHILSSHPLILLAFSLVCVVCVFSLSLSLSLSYSPEGRLYQVEYAIEAVKLGTTAVAVAVKDGIVIGAEKRLASRLIVPESLEKISKIDAHCLASSSGLTADARKMVKKARLEAQSFTFSYAERCPISSLAKATCDLALKFGEDRDEREENDKDKMSRPFGAALLFGGIDDEGPAVYCCDPSGTYTKWSAKAIGAGSEGAQNALEEQYNEDLTLEEGVQLVLKVLRQVMEEKIEPRNVELASIGGTVDNPVYVDYTQDQLKEVIGALPKE